MRSKISFGRSIHFLGFLLLSLSCHAQDLDELPADSLAKVELPFEIIDSATLRSFNPLYNFRIPNIASYRSGESAQFAYCNKDRNKWFTFPLPFDEPTNTVELSDLDGNGRQEFLIYGSERNYGSGGGSTLEHLLLITTDSIPLQVLHLVYGCGEESFGDRSNNGAGAYNLNYSRKIQVLQNAIVIEAPQPSKHIPEYCPITNIPEGTYTLENGYLIRKPDAKKKNKGGLFKNL